jgi:hypothetical protein
MIESLLAGKQPVRQGGTAAAKGQTAAGQTGKSQTGNWLTGNCQTGNCQTGKSQTGKSQTGKSQTGKSQAGKWLCFLLLLVCLAGLSQAITPRLGWLRTTLPSAEPSNVYLCSNAGSAGGSQPDFSAAGAANLAGGYPAYPSPAAYNIAVPNAEGVRLKTIVNR